MSETPTYRIYMLDGARKIVSAEWIVADNDEDAIALAQQDCGGLQCELWEGTRFIGKFEANRLQA